MNQMTEEQLDTKISALQKKTKKQEQILKNLQQQRQKKEQHKNQTSSISISTSNKSEKEKEEIIKNINEKIKIYKRQIFKISNLCTQSYVANIRELQGQLNELEERGLVADNQIRTLTQQLNRKIKIVSNDVSDLNYFENKVQSLKKKLDNFIPLDQPFFQQRSAKKQKTRSVIKMAEQQKFQERPEMIKKIDNEALYRNLIKYYQKQEQKLKNQISVLEVQRIDHFVRRESIQMEIFKLEGLIVKERARVKAKSKSKDKYADREKSNAFPQSNPKINWSGSNNQSQLLTPARDQDQIQVQQRA